MIPIKISNKENVLKAHWDGLSGLVLSHKTDINSWITQSGLGDILGSEPIKNLICGDFKFLQSIVLRVGVNNNLSFLKTKYETFTSRAPHLYNPEKLVTNVGITVCPYCNRSFIHSVNSRTRTCQLDHFYSKDQYPYLALSFFNLIPCCYACNHQKGSRSISVSPYQNFKPDELLKFDYKYVIEEQTQKREINIVSNLTTKMGLSLDKNFEVLGLNKLYKNHEDVVQEILKKKDIYSDDFIESLMAQFPKLIESKEEALRLVFGNYVMEDDLGKRPLAKLTRDIAIESRLLTK